MVFGDLFSRVDSNRRRLVFYNVGDCAEDCERIIDYVGVHDLVIEYTTDETHPESTVAIRDSDRTLSTRHCFGPRTAGSW